MNGPATIPHSLTFGRRPEPPEGAPFPTAYCTSPEHGPRLAAIIIAKLVEPESVRYLDPPGVAAEYGARWAVRLACGHSSSIIGTRRSVGRHAIERGR